MYLLSSPVFSPNRRLVGLVRTCKSISTMPSVARIDLRSLFLNIKRRFYPKTYVKRRLIHERFQNLTYNWIRSILLLAHDPWNSGFQPHRHVCSPLNISCPHFSICKLYMVVLILNLHITKDNIKRRVV